jgi:hypothetical protein
METINIKNNQRYVAVIAIFMTFSLIANINYSIEGKDILSQSTSRESSVVYASETSTIEQSNVEEFEIAEQKVSKAQATYEKKVAKINKYLSSRNSPLAKYSEEFVKAADHYGIDYRFVAAISIIESGGGKNNFRPYNAWGWGKSGFNSWTEGIWEVSKGLSKYYAHGATTPQTIAPSYCPPNAQAWASKVSYVMNVISNQ